MLTVATSPDSPVANVNRSPSLVVCYSLIAAYAVWVLLMPWVPSVATASMRRFHLTSGSFAAWAIQQPIPAMYNFANSYEVRQWPREAAAGLLGDPLLDDPLFGSPLGDLRDFGKIHSDHINHFPARVATFSSHRIHCCEPNQDRWLVTVSTYRGQRVETLTHLKAMGDGQFTVTRTNVEPEN